jgi:hypothetical protein
VPAADAADLRYRLGSQLVRLYTPRYTAPYHATPAVTPPPPWTPLPTAPLSAPAPWSPPTPCDGGHRVTVTRRRRQRLLQLPFKPLCLTLGTRIRQSDGSSVAG